MVSELHSGKRSRGAPKKRFKDTLKASLKCFDVDPENWELQAQQRDSWRSTITNSALSYEAKRILQAESKRQERKSRIANANTTTTANSSSRCYLLSVSSFLPCQNRSHQSHAHSQLYHILVLSWSSSFKMDELYILVIVGSFSQVHGPLGCRCYLKIFNPWEHLTFGENVHH